jgi:hypothetical protein
MSIDVLPVERHSDHPVAASSVRPSAHAVTDTLLRATGILLLMSLAAIHVVQLVPTFQQTPILGGAYMLLIVASIVVATRLVKVGTSPAQLWLPVAGLGLAVFIGYAFTRVVSTPLDNQDVGNWSCMLGLLAIFVEGLLVALGAYAMSIRPRRRLVGVVASNGTH